MEKEELDAQKIKEIKKMLKNLQRELSKKQMEIF